MAELFIHGKDVHKAVGMALGGTGLRYDNSETDYGV